MTLRLERLGGVTEFGEGWALFGRTLLVREGWAGPLPVEEARLEVHHYVSARSWARVVERCASEEDAPGDRWLNPPQLAKILGVTDRTVRGWAQDGRFPATVCVRVGRTTRILWPEAQAYLRGEGADGGRLRAAKEKPRERAPAGLLVPPVEGAPGRRAPVTVAGIRGREDGAGAAPTPGGAAPRGIGGRVILKTRR